MRLTNPLWYLAALLLALGSAMAATVVAASAFDPVRAAGVTPITNERIDAAGRTLAIYTDTLQPARNVTCHGRDRDKERVDIPDKGVEITAQGDGTRWRLIGLLEDGRDGLRVRCVPDDEEIDYASYGYATVTGYTSMVNNGQGIAILGATASGALAVWVFWCRRRARQEARTAVPQ